MSSQVTIPSFYECSPLLGVFLCVKNANKICRLGELSQSFLIYFTIILIDKKSIVNIVPDINKHLIIVFTIQTIQDIATF